jgi:flagellum-specific ATP synthase
VASREHQETARKVREALAVYSHSEDLIRLGAYTSGADPKLDASIRLRDTIMQFLRQAATETADPDQVRSALAEIAAALATPA